MRPLPKLSSVDGPDRSSERFEPAPPLLSRRDRLIEHRRSRPSQLSSRQRRVRICALLAVLCLGLGIWTVISRDTSFDGTFERGRSGWSVTPSSASMDRVRGGHSGDWGVKVENSGSTTATTLLRNTSAPRTTRGQTYEARAWVHAVAPGMTVTLRLLEWQNGRKGKAETSMRLRDTKWHEIAVRYVAADDGSTLGYNLFGFRLGAGEAFIADDLTLVQRSAGALAQPSAETTAALPSAQPGTPDASGSSSGPVGGGSGWRPVWADEFNGPGLDTTKWTAEDESTFGDGGGQLACLMAGDQNIQIQDGVLNLIARRENNLRCGRSDTRFPEGRSYSSALISSKGKADWKYGWFEMRAKLPTGAGDSKGMWPAFWMRPAAGSLGELDIMEALGSGAAGDESNQVHQTIWYDYTGLHPQETKSVPMPAGEPSDGFHVYAVDWEPNSIKWYIDGILTYERTSTSTPWMGEAFTQPQYLRLNLAVGGRWPGDPDSSTTFPASYSVDYVRVYQR